MSVDIHAFVEIESVQGWASPGPEEAVLAESAEPLRLEVHRDGDLFALLGHAPSAAGSDFDPITAPRGVPLGLSEQVEEALRSYGGADTSWLTLDELFAFDWAMPFGKSLWVRPVGPDLSDDEYAAQAAEVAQQDPAGLAAFILETGGQARSGEPTLPSMLEAAHERGWRRITWYQSAISLLTPTWPHALVEMGRVAALYQRPLDRVRIVFTFA